MLQMASTSLRIFITHSFTHHSPRQFNSLSILIAMALYIFFHSSPLFVNDSKCLQSGWSHVHFQSPFILWTKHPLLRSETGNSVRKWAIHCKKRQQACVSTRRRQRETVFDVFLLHPMSQYSHPPQSSFFCGLRIILAIHIHHLLMAQNHRHQIWPSSLSSWPLHMLNHITLPCKVSLTDSTTKPNVIFYHTHKKTRMEGIQ